MDNNSMTVITSKPFGALNVDVYQNENHECYMTREQIGTALEYNNPQKAIDNIVSRNKERFIDKSVTLKLRATDGKMYSTAVYTLKGVMEICRFSRQTKADKFMDFVWDIMESLMRGDSVLATPQMNAALAPEFIQAQFNSILEMQKKLEGGIYQLHKEIGLAHDKAEEARATSNEALGMISSVSQCVHQIKDKQMDNAIRAKSYTPRNVFQDDVSPWRKDLYSKIAVIANAKGYTNKETLHKMYEYLNKHYGFVVEEARAQYIRRTNRSGRIPTIDIIEEDNMWKSIMESVVKDFYMSAIERLHKNQSGEIALLSSKTVEAAPEMDVNATSVIEVEVKEVESESVVETKPKKQSETARILFPIMMPLAEKLGDKPQYKHTYTLIYERIGYKKMNNLFIAYEKAHGKAPYPKTKVFIESEKNLALFKKAVKQLMKEQEVK